MEQCTVNDRGIQLPDGRIFLWSELTVTLNLEAVISLDAVAEPIATLRNDFNGAEGRELLVAILQATCAESSDAK